MPRPRAPVQVMAYATTKYIQNNLTLNPNKTTCTLFTPDHAEYKSNLDLKINNTALPMVTHPNYLGLTLDQKVTYSTHIISSNGIETVCHQKNPSNDVKYITHMQSVLAKNGNVHKMKKEETCKKNMVSSKMRP